MSEAVEPAGTTVLVTGVTGFIGLHCARELLARGFRVRGTLRRRVREARIRELLGEALEGDPGPRLSFAVVDLLADEGWAEAVEGCDYVLHVASPVPTGAVEDPDALVPPARDGALRVLAAADASAATRRVVMTSSSAAILYGQDRSDPDKRYDESFWSDPEVCPAYPRSKTLAERAAWDFVEGRALELVTLCPGMIYGPVLDPDSYSTSGEPVRKLLARELPLIPHLGWSPIDVRDVADLHVEAMLVPEAAGRRFALGLEHLPLIEVAKILAEHFGPRGYRVSTWPMPNWLTRLVARFDAQVALAAQDLDLYENLDCTAARDILHWEPRDVKRAITDMGESLIALGMVSS